MIKDFENFINEDYFSKLASRKDNGYARKGTKKLPVINNIKNLSCALNMWFEDGKSLYGDNNNMAFTFSKYDENKKIVYLDFSYLLPEKNFENFGVYAGDSMFIKGTNVLEKFKVGCANFVNYEYETRFFAGWSSKHTYNQIVGSVNKLREELTNLIDTFDDWYNDYKE